MRLPYRFGRYVLLKKIAQGGMAEIFKAKYLGESGFSKDVCIKRLLPVWSGNSDFTKMLIDEAKALVHLNHPNIVQVYELGRDGKIFYISMELVEGIDLAKLFDKAAASGQPPPLKYILYIAAELLKALKFAHQRKNEDEQPLHLVHRDISPQNILLSMEGQVKVTDFGIAKGMHRSLETTAHQIKGKYAYMSPEQARGEAVDAQTDLYAAGIVLFEMLEGQRLFDGDNDLACLEKVRQARLPRKALRGCSAGLRRVVLKALQGEKIYRYPNAEDFLLDLQKIIAGEHLETDAEAFSDYLKELFPPGHFQETRVEAIVPTREGKAFRPFPGLIGLIGSALLLAGLVAWVWGISFFGPSREVISAPPVQLASPAPKEEVQPLGSVTIDAQPKPARGVLKLGEIEKEFVTPFHLASLDVRAPLEGDVWLKSEWGDEVREKIVVSAQAPHWVKTFPFEEPKPAVLAVAAQPWGEVTIPGVVQGRETPLSGLSLKAGRYQLQVTYPPKNQKVEETIQLAAGMRLFCQARFGSSPQLSCR